MNKEKAVSYLLERGVLISPEELENLKNLSEEEIEQFISEKNSASSSSLKENRIQEPAETGLDEGDKSIIILDEYKEDPKKISVSSFVEMFNNRYDEISVMLRNRVELGSVSSISRIKSSSNKKTAVIGMVSEKSITKNKYIILKIEDQTGLIDAVINPENEETYSLALDLVEDEVIGITGVVKQGKQPTIFVSNIYFPDITYSHKLKKSPYEEYLVILGDLHFGSKEFLKEEFNKFLLWINGRLGNHEQKRIAKKVKYIIIPGDIVEGVGVYPSQEKDLELNDIRLQYKHLAKLLKQIPENIKIIICSGNHDACRLQEPQPPILKNFAPDLWEMPNVKLVTNPSMLRIGQRKDFDGFDILLDHGYSFIYYADNVPSIRQAGGQKRPDLIMKFLLQRRHLAPTHASVTNIPDAKDFLLIRRVPDFFITGHIHRLSVSNYRNITLINGSCWTGITDDQIKRGLEPQPAKLPIVNLQTRDVKLMNFSKAES